VGTTLWRLEVDLAASAFKRAPVVHFNGHLSRRFHVYFAAHSRPQHPARRSPVQNPVGAGAGLPVLHTIPSAIAALRANKGRSILEPILALRYE